MRAQAWCLTLLMAPALSGCFAGTSEGSDIQGPTLTSGVFEPKPQSDPIFDVRPPSDNPDLQRHYVTGSDGVELFVETWLPGIPGGPALDGPIPTILHLSPYLTGGVLAEKYSPQHYVERGYAWAQAHVRGTSISGGCFQMWAPVDQDDAVRIIEYLGRDAPWSNGKVGMYGISNPGAAQVIALTSSDFERKQYLEATIVGAPLASVYDQWFFDGVPREGLKDVYWAYATSLDAHDGELQDPARLLERPGCGAQHILPAIDDSGDVTPYFQVRDNRRGVENVDAAVLLWHGHLDGPVKPNQYVGFFDRLAKDVHKVGVFGAFDHERPDTFTRNEGDPDYSWERLEWERDDWLDMTVAWYDHYLKGLDTEVQSWPTAQVQGMDGQWRTELDWPKTGGPAGQLALGPDGRLGAASPTGSTVYVESGVYEVDDADRPGPVTAVFETPPLVDRLEVTGHPMIDLWVSVDRPEAHLSAKLEAFDVEGAPVLDVREARAVGARSIRHLDPLIDGRFWQFEGSDPPLNTPVHVEFRFHPTDIVVPPGGTLRLTIAGSTQHFDGLDEARQGAGMLIGGPSEPSRAGTVVTIHHDCQNPSVLRFLMPQNVPDFINVREKGEVGELEPIEPHPVSSDGGGIATELVCGEGPQRNGILGPDARA